MKIILLSGKTGSGKSITLDMLYKRIVKNNIIIIERTNLLTKNDFECVILYNNKTVAIYSMGDYLKFCTNAIIKYSNQDILIMAYSEKFDAELDKVIEGFDYHCVIRKTKSNEDDIDKIISELNKSTNGI